jgi:chromosome segregation ATPase
MAIDHLLEQLLDRIRHDPDLRRQLAQLLFGRELAQLADQLAQLASLVRSLAESTQQGFQLLAERSSLVERELATLRRVVGELAEQQRATTAQIAALTERMERVEGQIAQMTAAVALLALSVQRLDDHVARARSWYLEVRMRDRAPAIFGSWMDTRRVVPPMEVRRLVRESLTRSQL